MERNLAMLVGHFEEVSTMWTSAKTAANQQSLRGQEALNLAVEEWQRWSDDFVRAVGESSVDPSSLAESLSTDVLIQDVDWNDHVDRKLSELTRDEGIGDISDLDLDGYLRVWETEALIRCGISPSGAWKFAGFLPALKETRGKIAQGVIGPLGLVMSAAIGSVRQWLDGREVQTWQTLVRVLGASRVIAATGVLVEADSIASEIWNHPIAGLSQIMGELKAAAEAASLDFIVE